MINNKAVRLYLIISLLIIGCYACMTFYGIAFWQSSVIRDTGYDSHSHIRGAYGFHHK